MTGATHRVVGAILIRDQRVLLCRRRDDLAWYPGAWDLAGGHIEADESPVEALTRECHEELGIEVHDPSQVARVDVDGVELTLFAVASWSGEPANAAPEEHERIGWFAAPELSTLPLGYPRLRPLILGVLGCR